MTYMHIAGGETVGTDNPMPVKSGGSNFLYTDLLGVTTSGARVPLPNIPCSEVTVIAKETNTGVIYVGDSNTSSSRYGIKLKADGSFTFAVKNANLIYIDASVSGEGISYVAI